MVAQSEECRTYNQNTEGSTPSGTNQSSINQFISRHSTEARATVRLCRIKEKCLKTDQLCNNLGHIMRAYVPLSQSSIIW